MTDGEREARENAREARVRNIVLAYHRVFKGKAGELVLEDLAGVFGIDLPAFLPLPNNSRDAYSPYYAAIRDGQRQVWLHIQARLKTKPAPDGNIMEARTKVKTGLAENLL
jgi:hypothetical protein